MSQASALEQQMLALVNAERAQVGVAPLTFDDTLNTAAEDHSSWMLENNIFDHDGAGGSEPMDRIIDAGYVLEGTYAVGENIGWQSTRGEPGLSDDVVQVHEGLMNSPSHRAAILNPTYTEIGIGIEQGDFTTDGSVWDSIMVTQNFGTTEAEDSAPTAPEDETTPAQPITPVDIVLVEDPGRPDEVVAMDEEESEVTALDEEEPEVTVVDEEEPEAIAEVVAQDTTGSDVVQEPADTPDNSVFSGVDWAAFDWRDFDFVDDLFSGSGNNNGNGNTGGGRNGQGNGLGNSGTGLNGTGNGNGNSADWNDSFRISEASFEPVDTAADWSWTAMDFASLDVLDETAFSFDDCFIM
ncbi:MAG: CAP domain-containing protein [Roseobacter sp.]